MSCWVHFSDGAITPLELFDRSTYSLTISTPDIRVATVRRTPVSTFLVAQGEGEGRGALVRVELRICEECQKSKRKSKLVTGSALLRINFRGSGRVAGDRRGGEDLGGASEVVGDLKRTVTSQRSVTDLDKWLLKNVESLVAETTVSTALSTTSIRPHVVWIGSGGTTRATRGSPFNVKPTTSTTASPVTSLLTDRPVATTDGALIKGEERRKGFGNPNEDISVMTPKKEPPKTRTPKIIESNLIRTFRSMSDLELSMYSLAAVSCVAILAFIVNFASYNLCFRKDKTPVQGGPAPGRESEGHRHDWVWLGGGNEGAPAPGVPAQVTTLKREPHRSLESRHSVDSMGHCSHESSLPTVSGPAVPERTATLGRCRASSQQQFQGKALDPMANRSATLLARPHRNEPLHSPTSKRNQVQFTTFTTLDIKHLAALKKNGVDLNWANQQMQQNQVPAEPQTPLPDMPWPVVKPVGPS